MVFIGKKPKWSEKFYINYLIPLNKIPFQKKTNFHAIILYFYIWKYICAK